MVVSAAVETAAWEIATALDTDLEAMVVSAAAIKEVSVGLERAMAVNPRRRPAAPR